MKLRNGLQARFVGLGLAALLVAATTASTTALFKAPGPGSGLEPVGGAEAVIDLIQGQERLLWSSISGNVTTYVVLGWPSQTPEAELGGALLMERPLDGQVGVIDFGEKPMSVEFAVDN